MKRRGHGTGSVRSYETKQGPRWSAAIWTVGRDGRRKQMKRGGFATRREAEEALRGLLSAKDDGSLLDPSRVTVREYATEVYLPHAARKVRPNTLVHYERTIRLWIAPHVGDVPLQRLTPRDVNRMLDSLEVAPPTKSLALTILKALLEVAVAERMVPTNVAKHPTVVPPAQRRREATVWTAEQTRQFLAGTRDHRFGPVWFLLAHTGMRRAEALALRWSDVDLDRGTASISRSLTVVDGRCVFNDGKTRSSRRVASLDADVVEVLRRVRSVARQRRFALAQPWDESALVFTTATGEPVRPQTLSSAFTDAVRLLGLPHVRQHDLRHGWATLALEAGVPLKVVSENLGHSTIATTANVYSHVSEGMAREAVETVAAMLGS